MKRISIKRMTALFVVIMLIGNMFGFSGIGFYADAPTSQNLADFLIGLTIDAEQNADGKYIVKPGTEYEITFTFSEDESVQFDNANTLSYAIPSGLIVDKIDGTFDVDVEVAGSNHTIMGNTYSVNDAGTELQVAFNDEDKNFDKLTSAANVQFAIGIISEYSVNVQEITFSDNFKVQFEYDNTRDLSISKTGEYDNANGRVNYTVTVTSKGVNTNLELTDNIAGTALTYNRDVSVASNKRETVAFTERKEDDNGFRVVIAEAKDGETFTFKYSAAIDYDKITYTTSPSVKGTVEETNNIATVNSTEVTVAKKADFNLLNAVDYNLLNKFYTRVDRLGSGLNSVCWTTIVNEEQKRDLKDATFEDFIRVGQEHRMYFNGSGITVSKYDGNTMLGTAETIAWNDSRITTTLTNGKISSWQYTFPPDAGNYKYVFTYTTETDTTGLQGSIQLNNHNKITFPNVGGYYEKNASVNIAEESKVEFIKEVVSYSEREVRWRMTVKNVSSAGYTGETFIVDDLPKRWLDTFGMMKDLLKPGSITVDGLLEDESYSVSNDQEGINNSVVIYFYKNQAKTEPGLLATPDNMPRTITVELVSQVDPNWLDFAANNNYTLGKEHVNNVSFRSNFLNINGDTEQLVWFANATAIPKKQRIVKALEKRSEVTIDGVTYPVFDYVLTLDYPHEEPLQIEEAFDTTYLRFYGEKATPILIKGGTATNQTEAGTNATFVPDVTGGTINVAALPKDSNGEFFPIYKIYYSLIVKDADALQALNAAALQLEEGSVPLINSASWLGKTSGDVTVDYNYDPYVDKVQVVAPKKSNQYTATFKVTVNKYAKDLVPNTDMLTVDDQLSNNLRILLDTVTISPNTNNVVPSFDDATNTVSFVGLPDREVIEITYQARVLGAIGDATYSNAVSLAGYSKIIEKTVAIESTGGGSASVPNITVVKYDETDTTKMLDGAEFQLFVVENGETKAVNDKNGNAVVFVTGSGSNHTGEAFIQGDQAALGWVLWTGKIYKLKEIKAPAGYKNESKEVSFVLSDQPQNNAEYPINGAKLFVSNGKFKLGDYVWHDENRNGIQDNDESGVANVRVVLKDERGNYITETLTHTDGKYLFKGLDKGDYTVEFSNLPKGYIITEANQGDDTKDSDGEYDSTNTVIFASGSIVDGDNLTLDLGLVKTYKLGDYVWYDNNRDGLQNDGTNGTVEGVGVKGVTVELFKKDEQGTYQTTNRTATTKGDGYYEFDGLVNGDYQVAFTGLPKGYQITDTDVNGNGDDAKDSDGLTAEGTIADGDTMTLDLGVVKEQISVQVTKVWAGRTADSANINLLADGTKVAEATLSNTNGWTDTLVVDKYNANGDEINYTVTEEQIAGYSPSITGNVKDGFVITNTETGEISIPVEKKWVGPELDKITVNLLANGVQVATKDLSKAGGWKHTFADKPMFDNGGIAITYTIEEVSVANYDSVITGSAEKGFVITNTNNEKTSIDVAKKWNGKKEDSVTIKLLANGVAVDSVTLSAANSWKHTFAKRDKYDAKGNQINYRVKEVPIPGYDVKIEQTTGGAFGFVITNSNTETVEINVKKEWVGGREDAAEIKLFANGLLKESISLVANAWQKFVGFFAKYDSDGNEIVYTVEEVPIAGYTASYTPTTGPAINSTGSAINFEVTNTKDLIPTYQLGDYVWYDMDNNGIQDAGETGVQGVMVTLTKPDGKTETTTTDSSGHYLFTDLANGSYQVVFSNLPEDYSATIAGAGSDASRDSNGLSTTATIADGDNMTIDLGIYKEDKAPTPPKTYQLGDYVWYDMDNNGIQDVGETGVQGVMVTLTKADGKTETTTTDSSGHYLFTDLANGTYQVAFSNLPAGYSATIAEAGSDASKDSNGLSTTATIADGDDMTIDLGVYGGAVLPVSPYKLGDYVWDDVNKNGIQDAGESGVKGVTVKLIMPDSTVVTTTTDGSGHYVFTGLANGTYQVEFSDLPSDYQVTLSNRGGDDALDSDGLTVLGIIANDDNMTVDLGIYKEDAEQTTEETTESTTAPTTEPKQTTTEATTPPTEPTTAPTEVTTEPTTESTTAPTTEPTTASTQPTVRTNDDDDVPATTQSNTTKLKQETSTKPTAATTPWSTDDATSEAPTTAPEVLTEPLVEEDDDPSKPTYDIDRTPDPKDPNSPDEIIIMAADGTPLGAYKKHTMPNGEVIYISEAGVPLGTTSIVKTGNDFPEYLLIAFAVLSIIGLFAARNIYKEQFND